MSQPAKPHVTAKVTGGLAPIITVNPPSATDFFIGNNVAPPPTPLAGASSEEVKLPMSPSVAGMLSDQKIMILTDHQVGGSTLEFFEQWGKVVCFNSNYVNLPLESIFADCSYMFVDLTSKAGSKLLRDNHEEIAQLRAKQFLKVIAYSSDKEQFLVLDELLDNVLEKLPKDKDIISKKVFDARLVSPEIAITSPQTRKIKSCFRMLWGLFK